MRLAEGHTIYDHASTNGEKHFDEEIIIESRQMRTVFSLADKVAKNDLTVLLIGESGVGKDLLANYIHQKSRRALEMFVPVNCAAIPESLFDSAFFGYVRGAFTNAFTAHRGYFEQADGGTIFLDEISEIPVAMQVKLLRALEERYVVRLGGEKRMPIDVRVIAASNRSLQTLVSEEKFRVDLYYRLAVCVIRIPPLREQREDIKPLAKYLLRRNCREGIMLTEAALAKLSDYEWPGNVRELESCILQAILSSGGRNLIEANDIHLISMELQGKDFFVQELEEALHSCGGNMRWTARELGIHRNTIYNKLKKHRIDLAKLRRGRGT